MTFAPVIFFSLPLPPPPPLSLPHAATNTARQTLKSAASPTRSFLLRPDIKLSLLVPQRPGQRPSSRRGVNGSKSGFQTPCGAQLRAGPYTPKAEAGKIFGAHEQTPRRALVALPLLVGDAANTDAT